MKTKESVELYKGLISELLDVIIEPADMDFIYTIVADIATTENKATKAIA